MQAREKKDHPIWTFHFEATTPDGKISRFYIEGYNRSEKSIKRFNQISELTGIRLSNKQPVLVLEKALNQEDLECLHALKPQMQKRRTGNKWKHYNCVGRKEMTDHVMECITPLLDLIRNKVQKGLKNCNPEDLSMTNPTEMVPVFNLLSRKTDPQPWINKYQKKKLHAHKDSGNNAQYRLLIVMEQDSTTGIEYLVMSPGVCRWEMPRPGVGSITFIPGPAAKKQMHAAEYAEGVWHRIRHGTDCRKTFVVDADLSSESPLTVLLEESYSPNYQNIKDMIGFIKKSQQNLALFKNKMQPVSEI